MHEILFAKTAATAAAAAAVVTTAAAGLTLSRPFTVNCVLIGRIEPRLLPSVQRCS